MPSPTKKSISDDILYRLAGGIPTKSFPIHEQDIWAMIPEKVNAKFKLRHFDSTLSSGETIPDSAMIATYESIAVTSLGNGKSYALLPINPISLPLNMGIFLVYAPEYPDNFFIPLQRSQLALLKADELLNNLMGEIGYEPKKDRLLFTQDLTSLGVTNITMELCVFDMEDYGVNDPLPIPADYVDSLIDELVKEFSPVIAKTGIISSFTNPSQQPVK